MPRRTPYMRRRPATPARPPDPPRRSWWRSQTAAAFGGVAATVLVGGLALASAERNFYAEQRAEAYSALDAEAALLNVPPRPQVLWSDLSQTPQIEKLRGSLAQVRLVGTPEAADAAAEVFYEVGGIEYRGEPPGPLWVAGRRSTRPAGEVPTGLAIPGFAARAAVTAFQRQAQHDLRPLIDF